MDLTRLPPWVQDPERLPARFWSPTMNALRRPPPPPGWHPVLVEALQDQGSLSAELLEGLGRDRLLSLDPHQPLIWQGPVNSLGDPVLVMTQSGSGWAPHYRVRAEIALWSLMYPELVEARWLVVRYHKRRRLLASGLNQLDVNPWHHWPGEVLRLYLKQALGDEVWFEFQQQRRQMDAPLLDLMEVDGPVPEAVPDVQDLDFDFLD